MRSLLAPAGCAAKWLDLGCPVWISSSIWVSPLPLLTPCLSQGRLKDVPQPHQLSCEAPWNKTPLTFDCSCPRGSHSHDVASVPSVSPASLVLHAQSSPHRRQLGGHFAFFPLTLSGQALCCAESLASATLSLHPETRAVGGSREQSLSPAPRPCGEASALRWRKLLHAAASPEMFPIQEELFSQRVSTATCWAKARCPLRSGRAGALVPFPIPCDRSHAPSHRCWSSVPASPCAVCAGPPLLLSKPWQLPVARSGFGGFIWAHRSDAAVVPSLAGAALPVSCLRGASEPLEIS